jgi:hypothetical protein
LLQPGEELHPCLLLAWNPMLLLVKEWADLPENLSEQLRQNAQTAK